MNFRVAANSIALDNLTISNATPQGGAQAEALMIESGARQCVVNNCEIDSLQDTILANINTSQAYFNASLITGNFDYVWGGGNLFFTNCEIRTVVGVTTPNLTAARTDNTANGIWAGYNGLYSSNGLSFVNCQLTRQNNTVSNCSLADGNGTTNGVAAFIGCSIDTAGYTNATSTAENSQLLWTYGCSNLNNSVALNNSAGPFVGFAQLGAADARLTAAANATNWLYGWQPVLSPNILASPTSATVGYSSNATFTVSATGIPAPNYQWLLNGSPVSGATNASLTVIGSGATAGAYSVVVTTPGGSATSASANLTVNPATLTVTANSQGMVYGGTVPALTASYSGFLNGDSTNSLSGAPSLTVTANGSSPVGAYVISNSVGTLSDANYNFVFVNGTLTITDASLTITANNRTKYVGQTVTFAGTEFVPTGLVNSDSVTGVILTSPGSGSSAAPGTYSIVPSAATGTGLTNYSISYVNGTLTVLPSGTNSLVGLTPGAPATLTANGLAGYTYILQRSMDLTSGVWVNVATNTANTNGVISSSDSFGDLGGNAPAQAFYRFVWHP